MHRLLAILSVILVIMGCSNNDAASTPVDGGSADSFTEGGAGSSADAGVVAAGMRRFALEVNPPSAMDYAKQLDEALAMGARVYPITLIWGAMLEKTPGTIDKSWFERVATVTAPRNMSVALSIPMIDTVSVLAPSDLAPKLDDGSLGYDDASVIARYERVLDEAYEAFGTGTKLEWLVISNEVNVYLAGKSDARWAALRNFGDRIRAYVKSKHPETTVMMSVTFGGISDASQRAKIQALTAAQDAAMTTYYLGGNGFGAPDSSNPTRDLATMLAYAGARPLVLKEWGYATGVTGNSPAGQAHFIDETFRAWDAHANRIPLLTYSRMWDGPRKECEEQAKLYGAPGNEEFIQFLCTLGVRTYEGVDKPGWARLRENLRSRGFF